MPAPDPLLTLLGLSDDPLCARLLPILTQPTGVSSAGYPYLQRAAWEAFRDTIPHVLGMGQRTFRALEQLSAALDRVEDVALRENLERACRVARQVVRTAAITAPPDLWLLRHVLGIHQQAGLLGRLLLGEAIYPASCVVDWEGEQQALVPAELDVDMQFLLSRGIVEQYDDSFRCAGHPRARRLLAEIAPVPAHIPVSATPLWRRLFAGETLEAADQEALLELGMGAPRRTALEQNHWIPSLEEVELGYRLVPVVLGLRASGLTTELAEGVEVRPVQWSALHPACACGALEVLTAAGWTERSGASYRVTPLGARGFARGPGPFGIIETYYPYFSQGPAILLKGRGQAWVHRGENVGASQDANRHTFKRANDALDRFCAETGFSYQVFVEHAIGHGEGTRQRYERSGDALTYVGADLEDDAIDAALADREAGILPANMVLVRQADIGDPSRLVAALQGDEIEPRSAVMLVGNGFHEVRAQTDERMVEVFRGYHEAGIVLLFTEENALSIDDLRATAWNTYHAGFKFVHEKSGQGLRPAESRPRARLGRPLRAAWSECARKAGYVRADSYCTRTRKIYPYPPPSGFNPSISVNHFFVPGPLARELKLGSSPSSPS